MSLEYIENEPPGEIQCKGSIEIGNGCGECVKCVKELKKLYRENKKTFIVDLDKKTKTISFAMIESIKHLAKTIIEPRVIYNKNKNKMAQKALESNKGAAEGILNILKFTGGIEN